MKEIEKLKEIVCDVYVNSNESFADYRESINIKPEFLGINLRYRPFPEMRGIVMVLANRHLKLSTTKAGEIFGKDHATFIHWRSTVENLHLSCFDFRKKYNEIESRFKEYLTSPVDEKAEIIEKDFPGFIL